MKKYIYRAMVIVLSIVLLILLSISVKQKFYSRKAMATQTITYATYIVQPGDTLYDISIKYRKSGQDWRDIKDQIIEVNNITPLIYPGQEIKIPKY